MSTNEELNQLNDACSTNGNEPVNKKLEDLENSQENSTAKLMDEDIECRDEVYNEDKSDETSAFEGATVGAASTAVGGTGNLEKLFQRQKMELAFELRRLQFSNRPVSSQDNKKRIEEFLNENFVQPSQSENVTRRDPAVYRPENTLSEIESLNSQHRVSSILANARERLENTLRRFVPNAPAISLPSNANIQSTVSQQQHEPLMAAINQSGAYANGSNASQQSIASALSAAASNVLLQSSDGSTNLFAPVTAFVQFRTQPCCEIHWSIFVEIN